jgi:hypothetical protein
VRVSTIAGDPGFRPDALSFDVWINSIQQHAVVTADEEQGFAIVQVKRGKRVVRIKLHGKITIKKRG